jgi:aryl-alcohol dehydrogenase-like predicted oxidoreductase
LFPVAQEMGIGIMPWSPLKHGFLSGKFRRENAGSVDTRRTAMGVPSETDYLVIDTLCAVAEEVGATAAAVALARVWSRPGVESTLIGARVRRLALKSSTLPVAGDGVTVSLLLLRDCYCEAER